MAFEFSATHFTATQTVRFMVPQIRPADLAESKFLLGRSFKLAKIDDYLRECSANHTGVLPGWVSAKVIVSPVPLNRVELT